MAASRVFVLVLAFAGVAHAQSPPVYESREVLAADRPEAWAMNHAAAATLPTGFGDVHGLARGEWSLALELDQVPWLDKSQRAVGFNGDKAEDLNASPVFGRVRAAVGLPGRFVAELGWTPPVAIDGVKAQGLVTLALSRTLWSRGDWAIGARAFGQRGGTRGDITCPSDIAGIADPQINPYGCEAPSRDRLDLGLYGVEAAVSRAHARWRWHAGAGFVRTELAVQVDALTFGFRDRSLLVANAGRHYFVAGGARQLGRRGELALELLHEPLPVRRPDDARAGDDAFTGLRLLWRVRLGATDQRASR